MSSSRSLQVYVRREDGEMISVEVPVDANGAELLEEVSDVVDVPLSQFTLRTDEEEIDGALPLSEQLSGGETVIYFVPTARPPNYKEAQTLRHIPASDLGAQCVCKFRDFSLIVAKDRIQLWETEGAGRLLQDTPVQSLGLSEGMCACFTPNGDILLAGVRLTADAESTDILIQHLRYNENEWRRCSGELIHFDSAGQDGWIAMGKKLVVFLTRGVVRVLTWESGTGLLSELREWALEGDYRGIAINRTDDRIAIVNNTESCVDIFNATGQRLFRIGESLLTYPQDVSFDLVDNLVVGGCRVGHDKAVGVFSSEGKLLHKVPVGYWIWHLHVFGSQIFLDCENKWCGTILG
eukprot:TRINITY_DN37625_c0_g1_i1.p1 TRINITY_DN37625_c0_g1~~TRINITY_DN37625_c0_g1_i1.p1  ORF type:complete len:351 (+),score=76.61 TRINITY_DN37625_c0_g1_i1:53-1105(+)